MATSSSDRPPADATEVRWRRRPRLAAAIRAVVTLTPLVASVAAGVAASRLFRPVGWPQTIGWVLWTGAVSFVVLALVDLVARRLLPLERLLQLCLVFPDRAPSRLRIAVAAARPRRPESLLARTRASADASEAAGHVVRLLAALATHDRRTRGHSERVCAYTELVAAQMQLSQPERDRLMWVALIHDIGKLRVPPRLLNKPGRPTVPEWQVLQAHPARGDEIAAPLRPWLGEWADAVIQHHERYDGGGYPLGLSGDQICLGARIIAVTDAFEVMTAPRPYRRPVDAQSARSELARHAGGQFDPEVVRQFLAVGLPQLRKSMGWLAWLGQVPFIRAWPRLQSAAGVTTTQAATVTAAASSAGLLLFGTAGELAPSAAHASTSAPVTRATTTTTTSAGAAAVTSAPPLRSAPTRADVRAPDGSALAAAPGSPPAAATAAPAHRDAAGAPAGSGSSGGGASVVGSSPTPTSSAHTVNRPPGNDSSDADGDDDRCRPEDSARHGHGHAYGWSDDRGSDEARQHRHRPERC